MRKPSAPVAAVWLWIPVALSAAGLAISAYLVSKRFTGGSLACSRWARCDAVNNSVYAVVYGLPVSVIGLIGYLVLLGLAVATLLNAGRTRSLLALSLLLAVVGFGFSIYLTYVEIYLIQALCSWCVASALVITLLALTHARNLWQSGNAT